MRRRPGHRSVRLPGHAYGPGLYFITVCTEARVPLFGSVSTGRMHLSEVGEIAEAVWRETPTHQHAVVLDAFVVMPDHVHLLFGIAATVPDGAPPDRGDRRATACCGPTEHPARSRLVPGDARPTPDRAFGAVVPHTVPAIIRGYKSAVTRMVRRTLERPDLVIWQREYHDCVVRSHRHAANAWRYIAENPARW